ncbi:MAG: DUF1491 family protein [Rhodospirillaceae bacterium]|jgi:hypothetical protein|nr:DUF1491 family protein [Rhodospirillaceae bacterium]MBT6511723.1 DUF1491 family protein [Rhodospirillaceae bacterium]MBT7614394.1 DUF1491 family protein [Rhodospirillaceae bacterium]MBT7648248.1 DUF1491 family protein [Rhodospirillaceae bacterium]
MNQRLKSSIWVEAQIRQCNRLALPFYVLACGDGDAGMILIKLIRAADEVTILSPTRDEEGRPAWSRPLGEELVAEETADSWLSRQQGYDPDLWIIEIDDPAGLWDPDLPIV